jgi:hypothetical protein
VLRNITNTSERVYIVGHTWNSITIGVTLSLLYGYKYKVVYSYHDVGYGLIVTDETHYKNTSQLSPHGYIIPSGVVNQNLSSMLDFLTDKITMTQFGTNANVEQPFTHMELTTLINKLNTIDRNRLHDIEDTIRGLIEECVSLTARLNEKQSPMDQPL